MKSPHFKSFSYEQFSTIDRMAAEKIRARLPSVDQSEFEREWQLKVHTGFSLDDVLTEIVSERANRRR